MAFLEYLSQKYPNYAYSIRSPGGTQYIVVSLHIFVVLYLITASATACRLISKIRDVRLINCCYIKTMFSCFILVWD